MTRSTNFDSLLQFDRFIFDRDEMDFLDTFSVSSSEDSFDSLTTKESSDSGSISISVPKKRKYKTGPMVVNKEEQEKVDLWQQAQYAISHLPKILKTDVRRTYSNIFTNVINSMDFPLMFEYLKYYCVPNFIHKQTFCGGKATQVEGKRIGNNPESCPVSEMMTSLIGLHTVAQFWYNKMLIFPDVTYQLDDTKVHTYSNTENSKVVSHFTMSATRLFDAPFEACMSKQLPITAHESSNNIQAMTKKRKVSADSDDNNSSYTSNDEVLSFNDDITAYMTQEYLLPEPVQVNMKIQMTMLLDNNKLIEQMEFKIIPESVVCSTQQQ